MTYGKCFFGTYLPMDPLPASCSNYCSLSVGYYVLVNDQWMINIGANIGARLLNCQDCLT